MLPDLPDLSDEEERTICACFRALLPAMKPEYAELIEAMDLGGETPEAVAGRLGITANNLKVRRDGQRIQAIISMPREKATESLTKTMEKGQG